MAGAYTLPNNFDFTDLQMRPSGVTSDQTTGPNQ